LGTQELAGRIAVVTGASKGLGRQMAESLAEAGASVALIARDRTRLAAVKEGIARSGGRAECYVLDVTDERAVLSIAAQIREQLGDADILINNAGVINAKPVNDFTLQEWNDVITTNLNGPFLCARAFIPGMKEKKFGRILNMTSIISHVSMPGLTAYATSKFGLLGFTKTLALELAPDNITVNGISPGPFATDMNKPAMDDPAASVEFLAKIPVGRWGNVKEVGALAVYLCSESAGFITGADILIDGGWTAQ
jgi:NAD(P)-dependent dehydrogenase (short-subunit alcohol dehydrogenase family)